MAAGCEGCIALFSANYARASVGLALSAIQGSKLCPNATVFVASKGVSGSVHDNEQIFYPRMLARSTHNEKGSFLLNGNNCVIVAIFHKDEDETEFVPIQGFRVRNLKECPESVAV